ncbi:MAG: alpha/beta hydrolase family protein [Pseudomonadales bacterium]
MQSHILGLVLIFSLASAQQSAAQETVQLNIRDVMERPADLYEVESSVSGVVMVPQSGLKADSWKALARQLNAQSISALALNFTSVEDVSTGIDFLLSSGVKDIGLIGGSVGGASILKLINKNEYPQVRWAIFLGTGDGNSIESENVRKIFVVAENDMFAGQTYSSFRKASEPKELIVLSGSEHGQNLFDGPQKERLERHIFSFLDDKIKP